MIDLMKFEIKRNKIRTFVLASIFISIAMMGFIYLFAYAPQLEPNDPDLLLFSSYNNIVTLYGAVSMTAFCTLASVMYSRFIIDEYTGDRLILLFSYPLNRKKILLVKFSVVIIFIFLSIVICNLIVFSIFGITELIHPLVEETITIKYIVDTGITTAIMAVLAASISIIATGVGFIKKSIPATIISAIILSSLFCNIVAGSLENQSLMIIPVVIAAIVGTIVIIMLMQKVDQMEVE
ncbi:ABC transporter permease [Gracilibacillus salitolerans]|uniref:ABC transporter permease n=1 Tax=Gracilibacillus salitolerans TaxID=2663022 RepID=A0A5Q2TG19_9BACI|nr:ABC transporter permease [Gracilibacillus salitolerans]QGH32870.1 ABC transporter permease [Gracilibacillus salitolerans]